MCLSPFYREVIVSKQKYYQPVPCGKCPECRGLYIKNKADRVNLEKQKRWKFAYMVTFTLNDDNYKYENDEQYWKRYWQLVFKRMRKDGYKFKYILVAERGDLLMRLHFHSVFLTDLDIISFEIFLKEYYNLGFIRIKQTNIGGIKYVLKYLKKDNDYTWQLQSINIGRMELSEMIKYVIENKYIDYYYMRKLKKMLDEKDYSWIEKERLRRYAYDKVFEHPERGTEKDILQRKNRYNMIRALSISKKVKKLINYERKKLSLGYV